MSKPKLIIVEAPQGGWKTTVTNNLRTQMTCSNLLRLSGGKAQESSVPSFTYYSKLLNFISYSHIMEVNFILDRCYFSEQVYARMGMKKFKFEIEASILNHKLECLQQIYDVYLFLLTADLESYTERLIRDKPVYEQAVFSAESSMKQQLHYLDIFSKLSLDNVHIIDTPKLTSDIVTERILSIVNN